MLSDEFRVVIPSRGRARTIGKHSLRLFPYATVTVDERELDAYRKVVPEDQLMPHPPMPGLLEIENWLHEQDLAEFVYIVADDLVKLRCNVGWRVRQYDDPELAADVLETTAICARDAGAYLFGVGHHLAHTYYYADRPFGLHFYVRNLYGYRRGHGLRGDPNVRMHYDVDIALQSLLRHRIIWRDERYVFLEANILGSAAGGNAGLRDQAAVESTNREMLRKWGRWVALDVPSKRVGSKTTGRHGRDGRKLNPGEGWSKTRATKILVVRRYS